LREIFASFAVCCLDELTGEVLIEDVAPDDCPGDNEDEDETIAPDFDSDEVEDILDFGLIVANI